MTYAGQTISPLPDPHTHAGFYASVPIKRLIAFLIDSVVIIALTFLASLLTFGIGFFLFFGLMALIGFFYRVFTITSGSATWGMRFMAIEFRKLDGDRFALGDALLHTVGLLISLSVSPIQLISIVTMLMTDRGQSLADMLFGTVAINRQAQH